MSESNHSTIEAHTYSLCSFGLFSLKIEKKNQQSTKGFFMCFIYFVFTFEKFFNNSCFYTNLCTNKKSLYSEVSWQIEFIFFVFPLKQF